MKNISNIRLNNIMLQSELKKKVLKKTEYPFLIICGIYLFELAIDNTMFSLEINDFISMILFFTLSVVVVIRVLAQLNNKFIWYSIPICLIYNMTWDKDYFPIISLMTVGCVGISYRKVLKVFIVSIGSTIALTILVALGGGIENIVYLRNGQLRSSLGIIYPTDLAAFVFFIVLVLWVYFNNIKEYLFIPLVLISIWVSTYITQSRTGMICSIGLLCIITYFMFDSYYIDKITRLKCVNRIIDICFQAAFPVCTFGVFFLTWSFSKGYKYAIIANKFMSTRLKIALDAVMDNGITLFGKFFGQEGLGATTYSLQKYTFVDISYLQILLSYGLVTLIMYCVLWIFMSKRVINSGDRRILAALALVAFDSVTEHHFMHLHYNIFLILPFADFSSCDDKQEDKIAHPIRLITGICSCVVIILLSPRILSLYRIFNIGCKNQFSMIVVAILFIGSNILLVVGLSEYVEAIITKRIIPKTSIVFIIVSVISLSIFGVIGNHMADSKMKYYLGVMEKEKQIIDLIIDNNCGNVYVDKMGEIYSRKFKGISKSVFDGEDLARFNNVTVIVDNGMDSRIFKGKGFLYSEISDMHGVYSNDEAVLKSIKEVGRKVSSYCTTKHTVDLKREAERNCLEIGQGGNVILKGSGESLIIGSDFVNLDNTEDEKIGLYSGQYTLNCKLSIDPRDYEQDYEICKVLITAYNGEKNVRNLGLYRSWFDENGVLDAKIQFMSRSYPNMSFALFPNTKEEIKVEEVSWQRTPDYDVHTEYDDRGRKLRDTYYNNFDNELAITDEGYTFVDYEYNSEGKLDVVRYLNHDEQPFITCNGYAAIHRLFDYEGRCIRQEFLDIDGDLVDSVDGYAVREWEYDGDGNAIDLKFFDLNNKSVKSIYGYAEVRREYDDNNRIIRENYYDTDGKEMMLDEGYSGISKYYDDELSDLPSQIVFNDREGRPITNAFGYASVVLKYNADESIASEEYGDSNNDPIALHGGYCKREIVYDTSGEKWSYRYCDKNGKLLFCENSDKTRECIVNGYTDLRNLYWDDKDSKKEFGYTPQ